MGTVAAVARTSAIGRTPPPPPPPPPPTITVATIARATATPTTPTPTKIKTAITAKDETAEEVGVYEVRTSDRAVDVGELVMLLPTRTVSQRLEVVVHPQDVAAEGGKAGAGVQGEEMESEQWWARARELMKTWPSHRMYQMDSRFKSE
jgi:hypothetical protein